MLSTVPFGNVKLESMVPGIVLFTTFFERMCFCRTGRVSRQNDMIESKITEIEVTATILAAVELSGYLKLNYT